MQRLTILAVAMTTVATASLAFTKRHNAASASHANGSMPSIQRMMSNVGDAPVQSFDAY
jgi:hypothetical protein